MNLQQSPAIIGLRSKTLYHPSAETKAINAVSRVVAGFNRRLPVLFGNRIIAWIEGAYGNAVKVWATTGIDAIINAFTVNGQQYSSHFSSLNSNATNATTKWFDMFPVGPNGGLYNGTAFTARQCTDTDFGSIPHGGNVSPKVKMLTGGYFIDQQSTNIVLLYDRVLTYDSCTISTSVANMTNTLSAQRYIGGSQLGLCIMPTIQSALSGGSNLAALTYVNQSGTSHTVPSPTLLQGNTGAVSAGVNQAAMIAYSLSGGSGPVFLPLAAGDSGVQSITSFQMNATVTGSICFALVHPIAWLVGPATGQGAEYDFLRQVSACERIYDGACLDFVQFGNGSFPEFTGALDFVWA